MRLFVFSLVALNTMTAAVAGTLDVADDAKNKVIRVGMGVDGRPDYINAKRLAGDDSITEAEKACVQRQNEELRAVVLDRNQRIRLSLSTKVHLYVLANAPESAQGVSFVVGGGGQVELVDSQDDERTVVAAVLTPQGQCFVASRQEVEFLYKR